ncbi:cytochrome P450 6a2-like [Athalia rosae]|uniref:cytochrome P450 6a2-like n=1 Tax=Athalia rosae TaxID=37344 RepID=UPI00203352DC|nr:cytochrome P450 6a2-like [Athalia rosae]XP_012267716.2 cytochrome P450 6a2-like [Athalia rosae]XP_012267717.2 cytochrome P450 6a2-like [Athalia rosae]XP_020711913.2 cytochrome P450 6a2-like [Athalia rosae]
MALFSAQVFLQILGALIGLLGFVYIYLRQVSYRYWSSKGVPHTVPTVPIGDLWPVLSAQKSIGQHVRDEYFKFEKKSVFGMYSFHKPMLVIRDPEIIRFVLTKDFSHFQNRGVYYNEEVDPLSAHLFSLSGPKWKKLRVKFSPTFTSGKMKYMFATVKECSEKLAFHFGEEVKRNNQLVEVKDFMARFSTDVISSVAFGIECNSMKNADDEFYKCGRTTFKSRPLINALFAVFPDALSLFKIKFVFPEVSKFFIKAFNDTVKHRTEKNLIRKDFLELVMQLMHKGYVQGDDEEETATESKIDNEKITMLEGAAQAFVFFLAGSETSSSTATHCLYELAFHQDIQDKLVNEIKTVTKEFGGVTYESIAAMPYLHKVVSETLRKYPSVPILNRQATADVELPGIDLTVTKGTPIIIPVYGLHSDPKIYPHPHIFDPERFTKENIDLRHHYAYLPFGEGPRNCIGMRFGLLQTKFAIISLLTKFRFTPGPDTTVPLPMDVGTFVLCPKDDTALRVEERSD